MFKPNFDKAYIISFSFSISLVWTFSERTLEEFFSIFRGIDDFVEIGIMFATIAAGAKSDESDTGKCERKSR